MCAPVCVPVCVSASAHFLDMVEDGDDASSCAPASARSGEGEGEAKVCQEPQSSRRKSIAFDSGAGEGGAVRSSKSVPVEDEGDNRSQSSRGSALGYHNTIENGFKTEDRVLTLLRRLLIVLLMIVIGLSIAITVISKSVISQGISQANIANMNGLRTLLQQVCGHCECVCVFPAILWCVLCCRRWCIGR